MSYILYIFLFSTFIIIAEESFGQQDTLRCYFFGNFKNSEFEIYYQKELVKKIDFSKLKQKLPKYLKGSLSKHSKSLHLEVLIDNPVMGNLLDFRIYRKRKIGKRYICLNNIRYSKKKYLVIRVNRYKRRLLEASWTDVLPIRM